MVVLFSNQTNTGVTLMRSRARKVLGTYADSVAPRSALRSWPQVLEKT